MTVFLIILENNYKIKIRGLLLLLYSQHLNPLLFTNKQLKSSFFLPVVWIRAFKIDQYCTQGRHVTKLRHWRNFSLLPLSSHHTTPLPSEHPLPWNPCPLAALYLPSWYFTQDWPFPGPVFYSFYQHLSNANSCGWLL